MNFKPFYNCFDLFLTMRNGVSVFFNKSKENSIKTPRLFALAIKSVISKAAVSAV